MQKLRRKSAIAKSRVKPEIYVQVKGKDEWIGTTFAKAKIRVKSGEYQYLQWREAGKVRSLYLGRKRTS